MRRGRHRAHAVLGIHALVLGLCGSASAQAGKPAIEPGATSEAPHASPFEGAPERDAAAPPAKASSGDEVIDDPELHSVAPPVAPQASAPAEPNGEVTAVLRSRTGVATAWNEARKDVVESTTLVLFEARVRRSERARFVVGVRARYMYATRQHPTPDADAARYELDAAPTAAYADLNATDGLHLRLGYQGVRLGRFDVLEPLDVLSAYDLRNGPATMPEAAELAQPALRVDWDASSWLSLTAIYLPFFQPHVVRGFDGNYALVRSSQADIDQAVATALGDSSYEALLRNALSRSGQSRLQESTLSAFTPAPRFTDPQGALRLTLHGPAGELSATAATALEHLPALRFDPMLLAATQANGNRVDVMQLLGNEHLVDFGYNRFGVGAIDAVTAVGPLQLGVELAYLVSRTLLAAQPATLAMQNGQPQVLPERRDLVHAGIHLEYLRGQTWVLTLEATAEHALHGPSEAGRSFMFMQSGRFLLSGVAFAGFSPGDLGLALELGGGLLSGPTFVIAPRVQQRLFTGFHLEAGAYVIGGKHRPAGSPGVTLGSLYGDTDQVFLGLRWQP